MWTSADVITRLLEPAAKSGQVSPIVRRFAEHALRRAGWPSTPQGQMEALRRAVRSNVRFLAGPVNQQRVLTPEALLEIAPDRRVGNCADQSALLAAAALSIGLRPRFVRLSFDERFRAAYPMDPWHHVIVGLSPQALFDPTATRNPDFASVPGLQAAWGEDVSRPEVPMATLADGERLDMYPSDSEDIYLDEGDSAPGNEEDIYLDDAPGPGLGYSLVETLLDAGTLGGYSMTKGTYRTGEAIVGVIEGDTSAGDAAKTVLLGGHPELIDDPAVILDYSTGGVTGSFGLRDRLYGRGGRAAPAQAGGCPPNSTPNAQGQCACNPGFTPNAQATGCDPVQGTQGASASGAPYAPPGLTPGGIAGVNRAAGRFSQPSQPKSSPLVPAALAAAAYFFLR